MIRALIRDQEGVALPVAVGVLLVLSLLVVALAANAMQSTGAANDDRNTKRALGAAEAGLQVANYRLDAMRPAPGDCLTDQPVAPQGNGECAGYTQSMGNGATFTYYVTPQLAAGASCAAGVGSGADERCITAVGTVNGEMRRLQARVLGRPAMPPLFPAEGVLGLKRLTVDNRSLVAAASLASNGQVSMPNGGSVSLIELGPEAPAPSIGGPPPRTRPTARHAEPFVLRPVQLDDTAINNANGTIQTSGTVSYNDSNRDLTVSNGTLTLEAGYYNFCRVNFIGNATLVINGPVQIFIDAPGEVRPGSGCPSGSDWGTIEAQSQTTFNPSPAIPANLQLYVTGWDPESDYADANGRNVVEFDNQVNFNGSIYAPWSLVHFKNQVNYVGAMASEEVDFDNAARVTWDEAFSDVGRTEEEYRRQGWRECRDKPTDPNDPESGC